VSCAVSKKKKIMKANFAFFLRAMFDRSDLHKKVRDFLAYSTMTTAAIEKLYSVIHTYFILIENNQARERENETEISWIHAVLCLISIRFALFSLCRGWQT
jgi:hypothetical protein